MVQEEDKFGYIEPKTLTILMPVELDEDLTYKQTIGMTVDGIATRLGIDKEKVEVRKITYKNRDSEDLIRVRVGAVEVPTVDSTPTQAATQTSIEVFESPGSVTASRVVDVNP